MPEGFVFSPEMRAAIDRTGARVQIGFPGWLRPFLQRDVVGITLGRRVFLSAAAAASPTEHLERLLRHELVHVGQVERLGLLRFLWRYIAEYVKLRRKGLRGDEAYRNHPFELEASAAENETVGLAEA
jgi:hypothetical protein